MTKISEYKFIDESVITAEQYAEFVLDGNEQHLPNKAAIKHQSFFSLFYPIAPTDTTFKAYGKIDYFDLPIESHDFDTLNYKQLRQRLDSPIIGITYQNVQAYCIWRTQAYENNTKHTKKKIHFSLLHKPDAMRRPNKTIVYEYIEDGLIIDTLNQLIMPTSEQFIGFRCVGTISRR